MAFKLHKLDLFAAVLGLLLGVLIVLLSDLWTIQQHDIGIAIIISCIVYLLFRTKITSKFKEVEISDLVCRRIILLINIIFLVSIIGSILIIYLNLYHLPVPFFILLSIAAGSIALKTLISPIGKGYAAVIILQIIVMALAVRIGIFYEFPTLIGTDTWFHAGFANQIVDLGNIPSQDVFTSSIYSDFPILHLLTAITGIITALDIKDAIFFSVVVVGAISIPLIYLIGRSLGGEKVGLVAAIVASVADMLLVRGVTNITPGTLVLIFYLLLLYLVFCRPRNVATALLSILLVLTMVFTHQLTPFVVLISIIGLFIGKKIYDTLFLNRVERKPPREKLSNQTISIGKNRIVTSSRFNMSVTLILIMIACMFIYWMNAYPSESGPSFFDGMVLRIDQVLNTDNLFNPINSAYSQQASQYSLLSNTLYHPGYLFLIVFAAFGFLYWLSKDSRNNTKMAIIISSLILLGFTYLSPIIGGGLTLLPHRWLPFIYILLILGAAGGIIEFVNSFGRLTNRSISLFMIISIFTFLMLTTPYISASDSLYNQDRVIRTGFKTSELAAAESVYSFYNGKISTDNEFLNRVIRHILHEGIARTTRIETNNVVSEGVILLRQSLITEPTVVSYSGTFGEVRLFVLGQDFFNEVKETPNANQFYDNGSTLSYFVN